MTYIPKTWVDESGATRRYKITNSAGVVVAASASIEPVTNRMPGTVINAERMNNIEQGLAALPDVTPVFLPVVFGFPEFLPGFAWDQKTVGYYPLLVHDEIAAVPANARGLILALEGYWTAAANNGNYVNIYPHGNERNCVLVRELVSGFAITKSGVVPLVDGKLEIRVAGATVAWVTIYIFGYIP